MDANGKRILVEANQLIYLRPKLNITELRLYFLALYESFKKGDVNDLFIPVDEFCSAWDVNGRSQYQRIKECVDEFADKKITLNGVNDEGFDYMYVCNLLSHGEYLQGQAAASISLTNGVKKYIIGLTENFTILDIQQLSKLNTSTSIRLYELLRMAKGMIKVSYNIEELKRLLYCEESYKLNKDFIKRVLDPALEQIKKTDLKVSYTKVGKSNKAKLNFIILQDKAGPSSSNKNTLLTYAAEQVGAEYAEEYLKSIEQIYSHQKKNNEIYNPVEYKKTMVKNNAESFLQSKEHQSSEYKKNKERAKEEQIRKEDEAYRQQWIEETCKERGVNSYEELQVIIDKIKTDLKK